MLDTIPQPIVASDRKMRDAVFPADAFLDFAPEVMSEELVAVADTENGRAAVEDSGIDVGDTSLINAPRAAGNDDAFTRAKLRCRGTAGLNVRVDTQLTNAPSD